MKKSNLLFILGCCVFLGIPFDAQALTCKNYSCEDLGYSTSDVDNCAQYIYCPFDKSYKACAEIKNEYTLTQCPTGATCDTKLKFTGCQTGYKVSDSGDSCDATCTGLAFKPLVCGYTSCVLGAKTLYTSTDTCASGYVKYTSKVDVEGSGDTLLTDGVYDSSCMCAKSACKLDRIPSVPSGSYLILDGGGFVRLGCASVTTTSGIAKLEYTPELDSNGCITCVNSALQRPSITL